MVYNVVCPAGCLFCAITLLATADLFGYDLHTKALTPITEDPAPKGAAVTLVKGGVPECAVVFDKCDAWARELEVITNAFARCTGRMPDVYTSAQSNEYMRAKALLLLGDQPLVRALGLRHEEMPEQGFTIRTFDRGVAIVGMDSSRIKGWNRTRLDQKGASRGTLFGALDFTERFLGCRYFFPGEYGSYFPKIRDFAVKPVSYSDKPYVRWRGEPYFFYEAFENEKKVAHYEPYLGKMPLRDTKFSAYFREGGTTSAAGMHVPGPQRWLKAHPDKQDLIFYKTPYGKLMYHPKDAEQCFFDVFNLELADLLVEDWKAYFASDGKSDPCGFHPYVNNEYITFGQCDYMLALKDYVNHPVVRELGLVNAADIARGAPMADANARFFQHLAQRIEKELPGKKLNILAYYTSRYASRNPKWRLPSNVTVMMCPGALPKRARNPKTMSEIVESMKDWQAACSGTPVSHLWFYTEGTPVVAAVSGEFTGEALVGLEPHFGREGVLLNTAGWKLWHYYWTFYASFRCQWNPRWDVDAGIDEHWPLFYGKEAGAHLRRFHAILKRAFLTYFVVDSKRVYPKKIVDALEQELAAAGACLKEGTPEWRRWKLIADFWPDEFKRHRAAASYEPPFCEMPRFRDEKGFWESVPIAKGFDFSLPVKFAWGEDGVHVKSAQWHSPTDIPVYKVKTVLYSDKEQTFKFDAPEAVIPYHGLTGDGKAPPVYTQWAVSGGLVRFAGREATVKLPAVRPLPQPTGHEKVTVSYKEKLGDLGEWKAIDRDFRLQNDLNDYGMGIVSTRAHGKNPRRTAWHVSNKGDMYDKNWGFDGCGDWLRLWVNGIESPSVPIGPDAVSYWEDGEKRGFSFPVVFDDIPVTFRFWMRPGSPALFGEIDFPPEASARIRTLTARIGCLPSILAIREDKKGARWNGYRREYVTAKGVDRLPPDAKENQSFARALGPDEDWVFLRDADFDGSAADKSKGIGPSFIRVDMSSVAEAKTRLSDHYIQGVDYTLKPDAKRFRFLIWGNHGRPTTFDEMFKAFKSAPRKFEL